jgi:outer membrane protein W
LGEDGLPILQVTTFTRVPVTVSAKYYLAGRGRSVSQFAWIPKKWAPFVGAGGGWSWYEFRQAGEFVDPNLDIIPLVLESSGFGAVAHAFAGVDISISSRFLWTLQGRYTFGGTDTGVAFDFADLDLSGLQATIGISARF